MLNWPLMEYLDIAWVDLEYKGTGVDSDAKVQQTDHTDGYSTRLYGAGGLKPTFAGAPGGYLKPAR
jgi:hypothetical protein